MKKHAKILTAMLLGWVSYTSALYAALDYSGQDVSREWWSSWSGDFKDANFTDATVIYTTFAGTIDLSGSNFTCANCQGASFRHYDGIELYFSRLERFKRSKRIRCRIKKYDYVRR